MFGVLPSSLPVPAKFNIYRNDPVLGFFNIGQQVTVESDSPINFGIMVNATSNYAVSGTVANGNIAVTGSATAPSSNNTGGAFLATSAIHPEWGGLARSTGCRGWASGPNEEATHIGLDGYATQGKLNYGVKGLGVGNNNADLAVGVYGMASNLNTSGDSWAMWADGDSYVTTSWTPSDGNLKDNVITIENASEILSSINATNYSFRTEQYPQLHLPSGNHYGVISQQLEEVLPNLVRETTYPAQYDTLGNILSEAFTFKAVNYTELIPILIAGFKEQQTQINSLQEQISGCCAAHGEAGPDAPGMPTGNPQHQQNITLTNADKAMLGFASPNPNKGEVYVDYYIPTSHIGTAEMLFTDATGRPVQNVQITSKGNGRLNIDTATLAAGQYHYTLIVDGEIIATRKMIRE